MTKWRCAPLALGLLFCGCTDDVTTGEAHDASVDAGSNAGSGGSSGKGSGGSASSHAGSNSGGSIGDAAAAHDPDASVSDASLDEDASDSDATTSNSDGSFPCAQPSADPGCFPDTCAAINGKTYDSDEELECGISPDGVVYCHWSITFDDGSFQWHHSDVVESGDYTCDGPVISATSLGSTTFTSAFDSTSGDLLWQGIVYSVRQ